MPTRKPLTAWDAAVTSYLASRRALGRSFAKEEYTLDLLRQRRAKARVTSQIDSLSRVVDSLRRYRDRVLHDPKL